jgi:hypothetical protein
LGTRQGWLRKFLKENSIPGRCSEWFRRAENDEMEAKAIASSK